MFPELSTSRLTLTSLYPEDKDALFEIFSNDLVVQYYDVAAFHQAEQAVQLIDLFQSRFQNKQGIRWAIRLKETNQLIGTCGFNSWNAAMRHAVVGYDLRPDYWGQGLMAEAVHAIIQASFDGMLPCGPLNRIQADTVIGNTASEHVLLKLGFVEEGIRRESGYWKDQFHDLKCFGLLKSEFRSE
ncbi:GNAT family protein [Photobacterium sp. MCCC 1A19761]|uniref:GNAT family N-acetyltransferase n=1 Tax=Photobacterium sp. MCCC 1A19761 TaxID=3115000 RepID=UPI00307D2415